MTKIKKKIKKKTADNIAACTGEVCKIIDKYVVSKNLTPPMIWILLDLILIRYAKDTYDAALYIKAFFDKEKHSVEMLSKICEEENDSD